MTFGFFFLQGRLDVAGFGNGGEFDGFGMSPWSFDRYAEIWDIG